MKKNRNKEKIKVMDKDILEKYPELEDLIFRNKNAQNRSKRAKFAKIKRDKKSR